MAASFGICMQYILDIDYEEDYIYSTFGFISSIIVIVFDFTVCVSSIYLLGWHIFFYFKGISTITYLDFKKENRAKLKEV